MNKLVAKEGQVFKNKLTGEVLGAVLYLGKNDSVYNYEEVLANAINQESEQEGTQEEY